MVRRSLAWVFAIATAVMVCGDRLSACTCLIPDACRSVTASDALFVASVVGVEPRPKPAWPSRVDDGAPYARVRVRVHETFVGQLPAEIDLYPDESSLSSCYARFDAGEAYLVSAEVDRTRGVLVVGACNGARQLAHVPASDLTYYRQLAPAPPGSGVITGRVFYVDDPSSPDTVPMRGIEVLGQSDGRPVTAVTGAAGRFKTDAPAGRYTFSARLPPGFRVWDPGTVSLDVRDSRGCATADIPVVIDGRIAGRLIDGDGAPVPHMTVAAIGTSEEDGYTEAVSDAAGYFEIERLRAGRYVIGAEVEQRRERRGPRLFFPGTNDAATSPMVTLPFAGRVDIGTFTVPGASAIIVGTVMLPDGMPVSGAHVTLVETDATGDETGIVETLETNDRGQFARRGSAGRHYRLGVLWLPSTPRTPIFEGASVPPFEAKPGMRAIDIVVSPLK